MKVKIVIAISLFMISSMAYGKSGRLPFINDNYEQAVSEAKQRQLPLFVDVWAPW